MSSERKEFDLLIIGSGIAGLTAAITAAEKGLETAVISKEPSLSECNTRYAQGGIVGIGEGDSPELLSRDIVEAGDGINYGEAVRLLAKEGPGLVNEFLIRKIGVSFCKNQEGKIDLTREAAHSLRRIYHFKDTTGEAIENDLVRYASAVKRIKLFHSHTAIDLITNTHNSRDSQERYRRIRVIGAYMFDGDRVTAFFSPSVILATGGGGQSLPAHFKSTGCNGRRRGHGLPHRGGGDQR